MSISIHIAELVRGRMPDLPPIDIVVPSQDDDAHVVGEYLGDAEGQSFMIEYVSSSGAQSRRRISVWGLKSNEDGIPLLIARCHERKATRTFRVDRIRCCIDYDGEVHDDVPRYIADAFGMSISVANKKTDSTSGRWPAIRASIQPDAVILAAVSRADYTVHANETEVATEHLSRNVERTGAMLGDHEIALIRRYIGKLRPDEETVSKALAQVGARHPQEIKDTLIAACHVMDADGQRHPKEREFLNMLASEWLAIKLF